MRIGIFTDSYYPHISGVATSIEMLKIALENMGHYVYIVAPNLENHKLIYDKKNKIIYLPGIKTGMYKLRLAKFYSVKAMNIINDAVQDDAIVIFGAVTDENMQGEVKITVIATGFELKSQMPIEEKVENRSISAAEFFSGAFTSQQPKAPTMSSFSDIQIPDFLRK